MLILTGGSVKLGPLVLDRAGTIAHRQDGATAQIAKDVGDSATNLDRDTPLGPIPPFLIRTLQRDLLQPPLHSRVVWV